MSYKEIYNTWVGAPGIVDYLKEELLAIKNDEAKIEDAFYAPLEFGTAGMRGTIGAGINRMNIYTVRQATEGLAKLIEDWGQEAKDRGVAISYDSRNFSPEFAEESARVLAAHGIKVYLFTSLRPVPVLSFTVRELNCIAGIMITASHNPAAYNGYKIYGEDGGQMPPADADKLTAYVREIDDLFAVGAVEYKSAVDQGVIELIDEAIDTKYLEAVKTVTINQSLINEYGKNLKIVFTPLHGAGEMLGGRALKQAGFDNYVLVEEQKEPNGDFPTVYNPNPEFIEAFELAIKTGKEVGADILIATDPDADRLGCAVLMPNGEYQVLTGNQIGSILVKYILEAHKQAGTLPANAKILKSIVSSELPTAIAASYGAEVVNVLTGFKFIAEKIEQYEQDGSGTFMFGFEESYGYLVKSFARDKDAIQALVLLSEVAAYYASLGKNLYDGLQDIFAEYGFYEEQTTPVTMAGITGAEKIKALMAKVRAEAPSEFGGLEVVKFEDFKLLTRTDVASGSVETLTTPPSDVLKYFLADGSWVAIRPSGTEPKIKFYIATVGATPEEASAKVADINATISELTGE
ncbi:MAG: phospho-sugar mutase [Lactobacillales bacterium]|jgi:phosphoglucomutase|nr:phospho-sugar mutase [Lactobacillales bacterium]